MTPCFFGSRDRMLFGVYERAAGDRQRRGVVICPPLMDEYLWSHRTCRLLADKITQNGLDVLRFDYFGSGDSAGESTEVSIAGAVEDTLAAIAELRDLARVRHVTLIGLRLGAAVAALASHRSKQVDQLVLWDPVSDGPELASRLRSIATPVLTAAGGLEVKGFPFPEALQRDLETLDLQAFESPPPRIFMIVSEDRAAHRTLAQSLSSTGAELQLSTLENPPCWSEQGDLGVGAIPADVVQAIAGWTS